MSLEKSCSNELYVINQQDGIGIAANRPGAGAPNVDERGNLKLRKGQTLTKSSTGRKYSVVLCKRSVFAQGGTQENQCQGAANVAKFFNPKKFHYAKLKLNLKKYKIS